MKIRNQQQLLLIKQLHEDASILTSRGDAFSLTKAVIFLDLAVEHALNNIVLNLDPDFTVNETKGSEDIARKTLWGNAARAMKMSNKGGLPETREMASLHALRNLVQHCGTEPSQSEAQRYLSVVESTLITVFKNIYVLEFSDFQIWDLVSNEDLRVWLQDCERALINGHPEICIAGCNHAHARIIAAIRSFTKIRRFRVSRVFSSSASRLSYPSGMSYEAVKKFEGLAKQLDGEIRAGVERFRGDIMKEIEFLEDEVVAIGVGLPLMDTRQFQKIGSLVHHSFFGDGEMQIRTELSATDPSVIREGAQFMLSYLSRLVRLLDEAYPGVLAELTTGTALHAQSIWQAVESKDSEGIASDLPIS